MVVGGVACNLAITAEAADSQTGAEPASKVMAVSH